MTLLTSWKLDPYTVMRLDSGKGGDDVRGDIWRAVAINRLQAPTLLSLRDSRPAKNKAESVWRIFSPQPFSICDIFARSKFSSRVRKRKSHDVIGINVFMCKLMKFPPKEWIISTLIY